MDYNVKTSVTFTIFGDNGAPDTQPHKARLDKALQAALAGKKSGRVGRFIIELPDGKTITTSEKAVEMLRAIS